MFSECSPVIIRGAGAHRSMDRWTDVSQPSRRCKAAFNAPVMRRARRAVTLGSPFWRM